MLLGLVLLFELRVCIKSDIASGVVGVMKNDSAFGFQGYQKNTSLLVVCVFGVFCLLM